MWRTNQNIARKKMKLFPSFQHQPEKSLVIIVANLCLNKLLRVDYWIFFLLTRVFHLTPTPFYCTHKYSQCQGNNLSVAAVLWMNKLTAAAGCGVFLSVCIYGFILNLFNYYTPHYETISMPSTLESLL